MNGVISITLKLLRTYGTKSTFESAGIRKKVELIKEERHCRINLEDFCENDPEIYESEFEEIAELDAMRERKAERNKELLPYHIVKSKYFKEVESKFLTYSERDQIKMLHQSDPTEWTPEKLSESFPALPGTIKKVLTSNWAPKSVERIINYDNAVIENWKNFKTGKLTVNPALREHLMKFRNRKISLLDRKALERFVPCPIVLPKPKTNYFSSIVKKSVDNNPQKIERKLITDRKKVVEVHVEEGNKVDEMDLKTRRCEDRKEGKLIFTEFMKKKLTDLDGTSREEKEVLLSTYRKHIESSSSEDINSNMLDNVTKHVTKHEKRNSVTRNTSNENTLVVQNETQYQVTAETYVEHKGLDTYVKERISFMDTNFDYAKRIKIPKNAFKEGMTYRIKDCYYDDDGEFLYRIPGLRS